MISLHVPYMPSASSVNPHGCLSRWKVCDSENAASCSSIHHLRWAVRKFLTFFVVSKEYMELKLLLILWNQTISGKKKTTKMKNCHSTHTPLLVNQWTSYLKYSDIFENIAGRTLTPDNLTKIEWKSCQRVRSLKNPKQVPPPALPNENAIQINWI